MSEYFHPAPEPATELGRYRILSSTAGVRVSPLCLGGMSLGDAWSHSLGAMSKADSFALLDAFFEAGGNFIDTANAYQNEQSEAWIGEWMAARGVRDQMVVATKYTADFRSHAVGKGKDPNCAGNSRKSLHRSAHASLAKLQTDYLDILYIHLWDFTTSIREVMDSLHILVEQGKALYLGVSDTPAWVVAAANTYALDHGKTPFVIYQGRWNLMRRDFEREIIPMAREFGMALAPWDVLGGGRFQTAAAVEARKAQNEGLRSFTSTGEQTADEVAISAALERVAGEVGEGTSITAVALAYVMAKAPDVFPIVGGRKIAHLKDNIRALSITLTDEQIAELEKVKPFDVGFPSDILADPTVKGHSRILARTAPMAFPNRRK